jgi:EAL domain-containing protein (putative c-di-GMP-specific phosphodiesterase class I)
MALVDVDLPKGFVEGTRELGEMLHGRAVVTHFQPIVELPGGAVIGYEALGRGADSRLPTEPTELFRIAKSVGTEVALSRLFRARSLEDAGGRPDLKRLFINTHPSELDQPDLHESFEGMPQKVPGLELTVEVHEAAIVNVAHVARLRARLQELGIGLAYDDFGSGQARLLELAEVPPDYLKFDVRFIRKIDEAPPSKHKLVSTLITVARDLGVHSVAEGVETAGEADTCIELGFTHAQGYFFSYPVPIEKVKSA